MSVMWDPVGFDDLPDRSSVYHYVRGGEHELVWVRAGRVLACTLCDGGPFRRFARALSCPVCGRVPS